MKKEKAKSLVSNIKYIVEGIKKWQPLVLPLLILHGLTEGLSGYVWLYTIKIVIERYMRHEPINQKIQEIITCIVAASIVEFVMLVISNLSDKGTEGRMHEVVHGFTLFWVSKVWTMPYTKLENPETQDAILKARRAINSNDNGIGGIEYWINKALPLVINYIVALALLVSVSPAMAIMILVLLYVRYKRLLQASIYEKEESDNKSIKETKALYEYQDKAGDYLFGKDIRIFDMKKSLFNLMQRQTNIINLRVRGAQRQYLRGYVLGDILETLQEMAVYGFLFFQLIYKKMTIADFTFFLGSVHSATYALNKLLMMALQISRENLHVNDYRGFIEEKDKDIGKGGGFKEDYLKFESEYVKGDAKLLDKEKYYKFRFEHVSFKYPNSDSYVLKNVSIVINSGEKMAIVGLNGAGKTTFVKLLCRLYKPTEGKIYLNDKNIEEYRLTEYWNLIAPVFQEDDSFAFSIAQNVTMKPKEEMDISRINKAIEKSHLSDEINMLPKGINTFLYKNLDDDGVDLSGGQKQKIILSRALYKNAPVIVLDEPSAALDPIAEAELYEDFNKLAGGKTCIYISHRLSSTKFCDSIVMFEDGHIVECGKHEQLLAVNGKYARLFAIQSQYYKGEAYCV